MNLLRTILFYLVYYPGAFVLVLLVALRSFISQEQLRRGCKVWAAYFVWCARVFLGIRLVVRGEIPQTGMIVAGKHQSAYEAVATLYLFDFPSVVMKAELAQIPVWGRLSRLHGSIFVERGRSGAALKNMLRQAKAMVKTGRPIFIFPEGTRVPVGEQPPLKAGLFGLYSALKQPVVPMALNSGEVWGKGFVKKPGTITVAFLPEVPPLLDREEMEARVHAAINSNPVTAEIR